MELIGERLIPAPIAATWSALNDESILKDCIAGCESLERKGPDVLAAVTAVKVGPVSARFKGTLTMSEVRPPHGYVIAFDGQGGMAGFGRGSADVALSEEGGQTRLRYAARAQVGGRLAQVGSRLIDAAAAKIAEDFFAAFEARLRPEPAPELAVVASVPATPAAGRPGIGRWGWALAAAVVVAFACILLS